MGSGKFYLQSMHCVDMVQLIHIFTWMCLSNINLMLLTETTQSLVNVFNLKDIIVAKSYFTVVLCRFVENTHIYTFLTGNFGSHNI